MATEQEKVVLEIMKQKIDQIKVNAIDYELFLVRNGLVPGAGHKTLAEAFEFTVLRAQKEIQKLQKEHLRKYPD